MLDLSNVSILCSVKIDSCDRIRNVQLLLRYLRTFTSSAEIVVVEQGDKAILNEIVNAAGATYHFIHSGGAHYKTRNLNLAAALSTGQYIIMIDADVILPVAAIEASLRAIRGGEHFVSPYNGIAVNVKRELIDVDMDLTMLASGSVFFEKTYDRKLQANSRDGFEVMFGTSNYDAMGGALIARRHSLLTIGAWNTNFVSYGFEDMEIHERIRKFGYTAHSITEFNCYHLEHERGIDSEYNNFYRSNQKEFERVRDMTLEDLQEYTAMGFKSIDLNTNKDLEIVNTRHEYRMTVSKPNRVSLSSRSIVLGVCYVFTHPEMGWQRFLAFLEANFDDYEIIIVEVISRQFKYLSNMKHIHYHWLDHHHSVKEAIEFGRKTSRRTEFDLYECDHVIDADSMIGKYSQLLQGSNESEHSLIGASSRARD